ncbi:hypothetical protein BDZ45DRAFT_23472, partial [Acephala macrosclerotiorum]
YALPLDPSLFHQSSTYLALVFDLAHDLHTPRLNYNSIPSTRVNCNSIASQIFTKHTYYTQYSTATMFATTILLFLSFALGVFSAALPSSLPDCVAPTSFSISGLSMFYLAAGNPISQSMTFVFSDDQTPSVSTRCTVHGPHGAGIVTGCDNNSVSFSYTGTGNSGGLLTIEQQIPGCHNNITGTTNIGTFCIPSEPPMPNGYGQLCQTPSGIEGSGLFSSS